MLDLLPHKDFIDVMNKISKNMKHSPIKLTPEGNLLTARQGFFKIDFMRITGNELRFIRENLFKISKLELAAVFNRQGKSGYGFIHAMENMETISRGANTVIRIILFSFLK